jgi:hypothetical protein
MVSKRKRLALLLLLLFALAGGLLLSSRSKSGSISGPTSPAVPHNSEVEEMDLDFPAEAAAPIRVGLKPTRSEPAAVGPAKVHVATVVGCVVDYETNLPIEGAEVTCEPTNKDSTRESTSMLTKSDGKFELNVPIDGLRCVRVRDSSHASSWLRLQRLPWPPAPLEEDLFIDLGAIHLAHGVKPLVRVLEADGRRSVGDRPLPLASHGGIDAVVPGND